MVDREAFNVMEKILGDIDENLPRDMNKNREMAKEFYYKLGEEGGEVDPKDDLKIYISEVAELGTWSDDPWVNTYGVDSSTTRPMEYMNGLIIDSAYAKIGSVGAGVDRSLEGKGSIITSVYYEDEESLYREEVLEKSENIYAEIVDFPDVDWSRSLSSAVSMIARTLAEGYHACNHVDDIDGALFFDGSIYPLGVIYWFILNRAGLNTPVDYWKKPEEIVDNYIEVIENQISSKLPVYGIVKTSSSSHLINALKEKMGEDASRIPWNTDHQFIGEVLKNPRSDSLTYTPWFIHKKTRPRAGGVTGKYEALEGFDLSLGDPEDYRRTFFFVRLPKDGPIFRVETPLLLVEDEEFSEKVQIKALSEIAKTLDVPKSIKRADKLASISRDNREKLKDTIHKTDHYFDYNWDGRWNDLEENLWRG